MSKADLDSKIAQCIDERLAEFDFLFAFFEEKFPEAIPVADTKPGAQPCDKEFKTVGIGKSATKNGFLAAYNNAKALAKTICSTGTCKTVSFVRYDTVEKLQNNSFKMTVVWSCTKPA